MILKSDFEGTFSAQNIESPWQIYERPTNRLNAMSKSGTVSRTNSFSNMIHLESTDNNAQFGARRVELTHNNSTNPNILLRWWALSFYFPSATTPSDTRVHAIFQWHDKDANTDRNFSTSPALSMQVLNDRFRLAWAYSTADYAVSGNISGPFFVDCGAIPKNQWVDFLVYYNPQTNNTGETRVWITAGGVTTNVYNRIGAPNHYAGSLFPYFKCGIYKWTWNGSLVTPNRHEFHMDRVWIGDVNENYNTMAIAPVNNNVLPTVNAGNPQEFNNSTTSFTLTGTATDPDGTIVSRLWELVSGPNTPTIVSPSSLTTSVTGAVPGLYTFRLTVTDDDSAEAESITTVRINLLPTIDLSGNTTTFGHTVTSINLEVDAADPDGSVTAYEWDQIDGPNNATIVSPTAASTNITGLVVGKYRFGIKVTDDDGDFSFAEIEVTIQTSATIRIRKRLIQE